MNAQLNERTDDNAPTDDRALLGFDLGGTKTAVCVGTAEGEVLARSQFETAGPDETMDRAARLARELVDEAGVARDALVAAGISCGGPLSSEQGLILSPPNLPGWDRVPAVRTIAEATGLPTRLENDANAGALAEWHYGAGRGCRNMIFLTAGTGMGAGLILDGRLYRGRQDLAGEVGHIRLADDGPVGYGKAGSFEGFCSGGGIANLARMLLAGPHPASALDELDPVELTTRDVAEAAQAGDPLARRVLAMSGRMLGRGLAMLVDCLNPELIVVGALAGRLGEAWLAPAIQVLQSEALPGAVEGCRVVPAECGEAIGDLAALAVARLAAE